MSTPYNHFTFLLAVEGSSDGRSKPVKPESEKFTITRELEQDNFYTRDKLSGPLIFVGEDYAFLYGIEQSRQRCQRLLLTLECRPSAKAKVAYTWRGSFTCAECEWNRYLCEVSVTPTPADGYTDLLETWDREVNLLAAPAARTEVTAQLQTLPDKATLEFYRTSIEAEADKLSDDEGWAVFLHNTSYISNGERESESILFRYVRKGEPMIYNADTRQFEPQDLSRQGYGIYQTNDSVSPPTADYAKPPEISGFKEYKIGTFADWWHTEGGRMHAIYGTQLLLLPCDKRPSDYGFKNESYIEVTGPGGANNKEGTGTCLNLRRNLRNDNFKSLWWRFGSFRFTRCFPLLDGLYYLLSKTAPQLLPPSPARLSQLFSAPQNPVTGTTGEDNELPTLLLAAGSDVKRYGSSEAATRLMVSLKTFVTDLCTMYDAGWFIDPVTGSFRIEHRSYFESQPTSYVLDLTSKGPYDQPHVPDKYSYRNDSIPKYERLEIANALTEDTRERLNFYQGEIEYSGACVNSREGQNAAVRSVQRLTGDVSGLVLNGDALGDSTIVLLDPAVDGSLRNGNRVLSASQCMAAYHLYGRVRPTGMLNNVYYEFKSTRPIREQKDISVGLCSLDPVPVTGKVITEVSPNGKVVKTELALSSGVAVLTVLHPAPESDAEGPRLLRQFDRSFSYQFG